MFSLLIMFNPISMIIFCLSPSSLECRKGLFRENLKFSLNKLLDKWFNREPLELTGQRIYTGNLYPKRYLFWQKTYLSVGGINKKLLDQKFLELKVAIRKKLKYDPESSIIYHCGWSVNYVSELGCTLTISWWSIFKYRKIISDGKHEIIVYFELD